MRPHARLVSRWRSGIAIALVFLTASPCWSQGPAKTATQAERRETISLPDAAVRALQSNLDISISRQTKESRIFDITVEQAKFDPTFSVNGQYNRQVSPLNRPVFGGTGGNLTDIQTFDQRNSSVTVDATQNLITGGNVDLNYSPARTNVNQNLATGFLFNPAYTGGLALTLTQPLLRNAGVDINKTFIKVAQNNADVEQHVFRDRVLTVLATVEQTYWELVFTNENMKVAQAALKAAEELLATNRAKTKAGVMSIVDVLQAEAAVASRVEQVLVAEKSIRDQEDQLRRLLNPGEEDLRQDVRLTPTDAPAVVLEPLSLRKPSTPPSNSARKSSRPRRTSSRANSTNNLPATSCSPPCHFKVPWAWRGWAKTMAIPSAKTSAATFTTLGRGSS